MKIALIGYGKMGKAIEEVALKKGHSIILKINSGNVQELKEDHFREADVAIEFSGPAAAYENILSCLDAGVPVISGSTGWLHKMDEIKDYCLSKEGCFLYASNFSIGVNIFFELNRKLASLMKDQEYDVAIKEIHHTQKKDAPSGTAISLAEQILEKIKTKNKWVTNSAEHDELLITSKRQDPAPGTHHVTYFSETDSIEIIHTAHNRSGFAKGAILAAEFIHNRKGIFSMKDILGVII
ncbi:MAG: 4-hydroxy-tetrahydrodipicolinate reductase [Ferruginibacter sp.]